MFLKEGGAGKRLEEGWEMEHYPSARPQIGNRGPQGSLGDPGTPGTLNPGTLRTLGLPGAQGLPGALGGPGPMESSRDSSAIPPKKANFLTSQELGERTARTPTGQACLGNF